MEGVVDYHGKSNNWIIPWFTHTPRWDTKKALDDRNMTQKQLAKNMVMTEQHVSRVIKGKTNISGSFAKKLEYAWGIPASFWMNLQRNYDLELAEYEDRNNIS